MPPPGPIARVPVRLGERSYEVAIGQGLIDGLRESVIEARGRRPERAVLVCDAGLPPELIERAETSLMRGEYIKPLRFVLCPSEENKSLEQLGRLLEFLASQRVERSEPLIALGGGIVGDLAGFAAATYRRGIPLIQCPTTLLAMVDASVGGKTAVNLRAPDGHLLKNMAGAFYQPRAVLADVATLDTLPERHFRAGLAECVKHAMLSATFGDEPLGPWMSGVQDRIVARDPEVLTALIARNVRLKAAVVEQDEREEAEPGVRAVLNLGHTFAHVLEGIPTLSPNGDPAHAPLLHGEAVALGLVAAASVSVLYRSCDEGDIADRARAMLGGLGLPTRVAGLPPTPELVARMRDDKKVKDGHITLVTLSHWGHAKVGGCSPDAGWDAIRA